MRTDADNEAASADTLAPHDQPRPQAPHTCPEAAKPDTQLQVVIAGAARDAVVCNEPAYDPESKLPRSDTQT